MESEPKPGPAPSNHSRKSYRRYAPATLRNLIALFLAEDSDVPRLLPVAIESVQKDSVGKGRRSIPASIWKDITKAKSSMPDGLFSFFSACLKGELGLPHDPILFSEKRKQLMADLETCKTPKCDSSLLQLIRQRIAPLIGFPPISSIRPRTWFRLVDRPDATIQLQLPSTLPYGDEIIQSESGGVAAESLNEQKLQPIAASADGKVVSASEKCKTSQPTKIPQPIVATSGFAASLDTPVHKGSFDLQSQKAGDSQTMPAKASLCNGDEPSNVVEDTERRLSPVPMLDNVESQSSRIGIDDVIMEHELSTRPEYPYRDTSTDKQSSHANIDDVLMEHELSALPEAPYKNNDAIVQEDDNAEMVSSDSDSDFDLELDGASAASAPEQQPEPIALVARSPDGHQLSDKDDSPDKEFLESDLSLDLDEPEPTVFPNPASRSEAIPDATKNTVDDCSAHKDNVSIQEIASELRKERSSTLAAGQDSLVPVSDFTKAFADITKPSPRKRKCPQRTKAKTPALKKPRPEFSRPAQKFSTPCQFWVEMRCSKGDQCPFSHDAAQVRRTEICRYFMMGSCLKGEDCSHSHQVPCKFFHLQNSCREVDCRFSHDPMTEEEITLFRNRVDEGFYLKPLKPSDEPKDANVENPFLI